MNFYNQKRVVQKTMSGKTLKVWSGAVEASKALGVASSSSISMCCTGKLKQAHGFVWSYGKPYTVEERFFSKVKKTKKCWQWTAATANENGYGTFGIMVGGKPVYVSAHRFSYELANGKIPDGLTLDHLCRNTRCVRPSHLEAVTMGVNVLRGYSPSAVWARRTHCLRGHKLLVLPKPKANGAKRWCPPCTKVTIKASTVARAKKKKLLEATSN